MKIAFYAPMKSPRHHQPSGDRAIARLFIKLLESLGHQAVLVSELRSFDGRGSIARQREIKRLADEEVAAILGTYSDGEFDLVFIYHLYHKAPDWIGIELSKHWNIPYCIAEASHAPKQANGPWATGHVQAMRCIRHAQSIVSLNATDLPCISALLAADQKQIYLPPFMADPEPASADRPNPQTRKARLRKQLAQSHQLDADAVWLLAVAMMRPGDKQASYRILATALASLPGTRAGDWQLIVIGDGAIRPHIDQMFQSVIENCRFHGEQDAPQISAWMWACDWLVWPAVNEAFGMSILEAGAHGLAVIAGDDGGVGDIINAGKTGYLVPPGDAAAFARCLAGCLNDRNAAQSMGEAGREKFLAMHSLHSAAGTLRREKVLSASLCLRKP